LKLDSFKALLLFQLKLSILLV